MGYITKDRYEENVLILPHDSDDFWSVSLNSNHDFCIRGTIIDELAKLEEREETEDIEL